MTVNQTQHAADPHTRRRCRRVTAFSLVELLTVVFIISLLIGILIPSINAARTSAKKLVTKKTIDTITVGLELFKNDAGVDFRQTNGYPPSFAHPKLAGYPFNAFEGRFPFLPGDSASSPLPVVYGAHWLPAMLMGADNLGYVKRSNVPNKEDIRKEPWRWYRADPFGQGAEGRILDRMDLYLNPDDVPTLPTKKLTGRPPQAVEEEGSSLFPDWKTMSHLPVIVDKFDQPILYYVANTHGQTQNMVEGVRTEDGKYAGGAQQIGVPYYFHQDNEGFTGIEGTEGWDFGNPRKEHAIGTSGADLAAQAVVDPDNRDTFARYILDRKVATILMEERTAPLRPVNADTFLLISAGPDGRYGTADDVSNLPPWPE